MNVETWFACVPRSNREGIELFALDHIHIYAADPDRTVAFYERHFGAERIGALRTRDGRDNHFVVLGAQVVVVSTFPPGLEARTPPEVGDGASSVGFGISHIGINVPDVHACVRELSDAGVEVHDEVVTSGPIRYVYVSGPDGVVLELTQYVLPARLRPAVLMLDVLNRSIHATRKAITGTLLRFANRDA